MEQELHKLFVDQYGNKFYAKNPKHLKEQYGIKGKIERIFNDGVDGKTYWTGYKIGQHWFDLFTPLRVCISRREKR